MLRQKGDGEALRLLAEVEEGVPPRPRVGFGLWWGWVGGSRASEGVWCGVVVVVGGSRASKRTKKEEVQGGVDIRNATLRNAAQRIQTHTHTHTRRGRRQDNTQTHSHKKDPRRQGTHPDELVHELVNAHRHTVHTPPRRARTRMNLSMSSGASGKRSGETLWKMLSTARAAFFRTYEWRCSRQA